MSEEKKRKIALNCAKKPNRGLAYINDLEKYDNLTHEPWLEKMVDDIRNGNDALKDELPIRCSHYYRFNDNHRRQADMDPEAFLFQTCVDIDDLEAVEPAITRAYLINDEEGGKWQNHLLHMEYSARKKLHYPRRDDHRGSPAGLHRGSGSGLRQQLYVARAIHPGDRCTTGNLSLRALV